jgi:hypothetical protein
MGYDTTWFIHLHLVSLRGSSHTGNSCFSLILRFVGSVMRTSRTVGFDPLPNPKNASILQFTVSDGVETWARWDWDMIAGTLRLRSNCRPPFEGEDTVEVPEP